MASDPPIPIPILEPEPPLRTISFAHNPAVMQVSTALRRLWLIDSASLGLVGAGAESEGVETSGATDPQLLQSAFQDAMRNLGNWIATTPAHERWRDDVWRAQTEYALLDPPEGDGEVDEAGEGPLFTPLRRAVYGVYDHVFWDVYQALKEEAGAVGVGEYQPPATVVMVLRFAGEGGDGEGGWGGRWPCGGAVLL